MAHTRGGAQPRKTRAGVCITELISATWVAVALGGFAPGNGVLLCAGWCTPPTQGAGQGRVYEHGACQPTRSLFVRRKYQGEKKEHFATNGIKERAFHHWGQRQLATTGNTLHCPLLAASTLCFSCTIPAALVPSCLLLEAWYRLLSPVITVI